MTTRKYSSRSQQTTLSGALTSAATSMTVVNASILMASISPTGGETYTVVIDPDTSLEEIVDVTNVSGNTLTITRAVDGSTAQAHSAGAVIRHMVTGRDLREANTHIEASTGVHGLSGTVVGTTDSQPLTNKTISGSSNTLTNIPNSATTATNSNTPSTIVARDASGNFSAGTITANLTGNVSGSSGSTTGNAATATALQTARDFQILGDVEASAVSFDGTGNVNLTTQIATGVIVNADVNASANIAATKIAGTAVTQADTGTVTSTMIANDTIVDADISASAAIAKTKIAGTAIAAADTETVTSAMIANGTIVDEDISATAGIAYSKLSLGGTITSADIVDGTIVNSDINASAGIALSKLATDPLARANHTGTQTASTISDFDTQVRTNRLDQMAAPTGSVSLNSQKITSLATPTDSGDAATKGYIDTEITNLINGAPGTLDTLKEIADEIQAGGTFYDAVVFKTGSTMTGALILNADPTVDLGAATKQYVDVVAGSATAAAASAAAAEASYDSFDDRYLGSKSTPPTLDNDGNALITGALYWNSVDGAMYAWTGSEWGSISSTAAIYRYRFTATGGETSVSGLDDNGLTLSYIAGKEQVYLNGVLLARTSDYDGSNGTSISSLAALAADDIVEIITFTAFDLATAIELSAFDAKGDLLVGASDNTLGKLSVGTNGYFLQADSAETLGVKWAQVDLASYATLTGTETLTNKTLTAPLLNNAVIKSPEERWTVSATAATGTVNFDALTQGVLYYTSNASGNWTLNVRGDSGTTLNSVLTTGDALTVAFLVTNGGTAYYHTALQIDGSAQTVKWSSGTAPAAGNASSIDAYSFTIVKTGSATYTVLGAGPIKYA